MTPEDRKKALDAFKPRIFEANYLSTPLQQFAFRCEKWLCKLGVHTCGHFSYAEVGAKMIHAGYFCRYCGAKLRYEAASNKNYVIRAGRTDKEPKWAA
jgi:hypothetical protein